MLHFNVVFLFLKFQKHVAASPSQVGRMVTAQRSIHLGDWPGSWPGLLNLRDSEFSRITFWGVEETSGNIEKFRIISGSHNSQGTLCSCCRKSEQKWDLTVFRFLYLLKSPALTDRNWTEVDYIQLAFSKTSKGL